MPRKSPDAVELCKDERAEPEFRVRKYASRYRNVIRAKIILLATQGLSRHTIASCLDTPRQIVSKWRNSLARKNRFVVGGQCVSPPSASQASK